MAWPWNHSSCPSKHLEDAEVKLRELALFDGIDKHGRVNEWNLKIAEIMVWHTPNT